MTQEFQMARSSTRFSTLFTKVRAYIAPTSAALRDAAYRMLTEEVAGMADTDTLRLTKADAVALVSALAPVGGQAVVSNDLRPTA